VVSAREERPSFDDVFATLVERARGGRSSGDRENQRDDQADQADDQRLDDDPSDRKPETRA
jgi:hypothetical protein